MDKIYQNVNDKDWKSKSNLNLKQKDDYQIKRQFKKIIIKKLLDTINDKKNVLYAVSKEYSDNFNDNGISERLSIDDIIDLKCKDVGY